MGAGLHAICSQMWSVGPDIGGAVGKFTPEGAAEFCSIVEAEIFCHFEDAPPAQGSASTLCAASSRRFWI